jgi:hypothetical protein
MSELELALADLGRRVEFPPTPDLAPAVRARLAAGRSGGRGMARPYTRRRIVALVLAVLAVALAAVLAVPQTRAAILEFFHLRGVSIERVGALPTVPEEQAGPGLVLGKKVTLAEARDAVRFEVLVPSALGEPNETYVQTGFPPGGMVSMIYGSREHPRVLLTEFRATVEEVIFKKVAVDTTIERTAVDGGAGYWIGGAHLFSYFDANGAYQEEPIRLAGKTLVWERGPLTLRLEGDFSKADALRIARSVQ